MSIFEIFTLLGGVGLFLYGMSIMSTGLKNAAGEKLASILEHATSNRFVAVFVGILVTILIQSSSATDMMVIGFVNSGLMTLVQAIGVILGANIGTTVTAQITAFNLGLYAPLILFVGSCMHLFLKKSTTKHIGTIILGFGMLFVGIAIIKTAIAPLAQSAEFIHFLKNLDNPAIAVIFGVAFTALLQSSSSSTVIFQTFAIEGLLTFEMTVYLIIGAAIGAVMPNFLASLTTNRNGKRTALLNLLFNLIRAALLITIINIFPQFLSWIQSLSPNDVGRQIANAHTIFAIVAVLMVLPFTKRLVHLTQMILPVKPEETRKIRDRQLLYMVKNDKLPAAMALQQAKLEIVRMGRIARDNMKLAIDCFFNPDPKLAEEVEDVEDTINYLNHAITDALVGLRALDMSQRELNRVSKLMMVVTDIERLGDHAENIVEYSAQLKKTHISEDARKDLQKIATASMVTIDQCLFVFEHENFDLLQQAEANEQYVDALQIKIVNNHLDRLLHSQCEPLAGVIFTDMASDLERCSDHAINIAFSLHDYDYLANHVYTLN
jgi:phosphate:Na+ symporter